MVHHLFNFIFWPKTKDNFIFGFVWRIEPKSKWYYFYLPVGWKRWGWNARVKSIDLKNVPMSKKPFFSSLNFSRQSIGVQLLNVTLTFLLYLYLTLLLLIPKNLASLLSKTHQRTHRPSLSLSSKQIQMGNLEVERTTTGWAARDASGILSPYTYTIR